MTRFAIAALSIILVALSAAAPNRIMVDRKDNLDFNTTSDPRLYRRTGEIKLGLGTQHVNVGSMDTGAIYGNVYHVLQGLCDSSKSSCDHFTTATFQVFVDNEVKVEAVGVTVEASQYHGEQILRLLIGSVAGSVERGTWHEKSCREVHTGGRATTHCNTVDYVSIEIPGENYLKVRFSSSKNRGEFDCMAILGYARNYVETLQMEMENAVGDTDLYMGEWCIW